MKSIDKSDEWLALERHWSEIEPRHMRAMFAEDPARFERMSLQACGILLDYSKNRATGETMDLLLKLAERVDLKAWIERMFRGERINNTEDRAVLHTALRNRSSEPVLLDGEDVMPKVRAVLSQMED
ncbi:MAG: glucose-6-phosphate isomerase, partial [Gammaproteobacteria bacterium]|nr:glucose-6-phosphate isomerase [Gammaproteobacteria bacterium]